jgi:hypothetical protein
VFELEEDILGEEIQRRHSELDRKGMGRMLDLN